MVGQKGIPATYGGIERHVEEISARLVARGHDVTVYCRKHYNGEGEDYYRGVRLRRYPSIKTKHFDTASHVLRCSLEFLANRYDVVHFHALGPSIFAYLPRLRRSSSVVTVHGLDWERDKWGAVAAWALKQCEYPSIHFPSRTVVVSRTLHDYYMDKYGLETTIIPNGTNMPNPRPANKIRDVGLVPGRYILFVGRLVPEKGVHFLVEAFSKLGAVEDFQLVLAGGTSFSDDYVRELQKHESDRVHLVGYVYGDLLEELWSNAYLVVQPSTLEGLSISLLEALSYGRCVLTSDIPENLEVVNGSAPTFKSRDVDDLRAKLLYLLQNPGVVADYGQQSRDLVARDYSWGRVVDELEAVYDRAVGAPTEPKGDGSRLLPI